MKINFSVIIPNLNGGEYITKCFESLQLAILKCTDTKFEIIFVDNGSTDNSIELFRKYFCTSYIKNNTNYGFAKAVNQGIAVSKYEYVCVLNNDLTLDKNWFKLIKASIVKKPQGAAFCGTVLNHDGTKIESQGFKYYYSGKCENINNNKMFSKNMLHNSVLKVWGSSAAAVVYKKTHILNIGLFDEKFFAYIEDVDLSLRLDKRSLKTWLNPQAISYHLGGQTSIKMGNFRAKQSLINWIRLIHKNYSVGEIYKNLPGILIERLRNLSYYIRSSSIINKLW